MPWRTTKSLTNRPIATASQAESRFATAKVERARVLVSRTTSTLLAVYGRQPPCSFDLAAFQNRSLHPVAAGATNQQCWADAPDGLNLAERISLDVAVKRSARGVAASVVDHEVAARVVVDGLRIAGYPSTYLRPAPTRRSIRAWTESSPADLSASWRAAGVDFRPDHGSAASAGRQPD
jgi:hypothetical protein